MAVLSFSHSHRHVHSRYIIQATVKPQNIIAHEKSFNFMLNPNWCIFLFSMTVLVCDRIELFLLWPGLTGLAGFDRISKECNI